MTNERATKSDNSSRNVVFQQFCPRLSKVTQGRAILTLAQEEFVGTGCTELGPDGY
jgi:hypothetical protein